MKKIDENILEKVKLKCYEVLLHGIIDQEAMSEAKVIAEEYLRENGFSEIEAKCDYENNSPDVIDSGNIYVDIFEKEFKGSTSFYKHRIVL